VIASTLFEGLDTVWGSERMFGAEHLEIRDTDG
jgi:hypothetical protein